ncbi:hypothetical protein EUTSA_v10017976mg [Eutrema salsugineum]|uniref:F-box domain-containing protein n=1 Tax=Eutrema salsugineum TaxID=72664 RepID=V4P108_EUTSA|nr:hypothetical protein EUTSA_v10017976mg [Eutrema salsugineum]
MSPPEELPWDLVGEILSRVPTKSLARFRAVCKQWNAIWDEKSFLDNYLSRTRPQFIIRTNSHIRSVEINLNDEDQVSPIEVRDITLDSPNGIRTSIHYCDGFLLFTMKKRGFAIWNPWSRQKRFIENHEFIFYGVGYDNTRPETGYKIFGVLPSIIYECKSDAWKFLSGPCDKSRMQKLDSMVSLNGNLYFHAFDSKTRECLIQSFDFSKDIFKTICVLPSNEDIISTRALEVFRGDRLSMLTQSYLTRKVEILVTKQKIDVNGEAIVWINFMTVSIPNFPRLQPHFLGFQPTYFVDNIDEKRLFVCTCDETAHACIYIVKGDVFRKIPIDYEIDRWSFLYTSFISYIPSFVSIPCIQREEQGLQV